MEVGGSQFEARPGKVTVKPYLKNNLKGKGLGAWSTGRELV
jgi:hypothetical protein